MEYLKTTKAIRFKLNAKEENYLIQKLIENLSNVSFDLAGFVSL